MTTFRSGRHLKAARALAGLTQRELAHEAGLHQNSIKYWERFSSTVSGIAVGRIVDALTSHGVVVIERGVVDG